MYRTTPPAAAAVAAAAAAVEGYTNAHVFVETGRLREALTTRGTLVRSVLLMHVQHVYPQSIALLERSRAQGARKSPVALWG